MRRNMQITLDNKINILRSLLNNKVLQKSIVSNLYPNNSLRHLGFEEASSNLFATRGSDPKVSDSPLRVRYLRHHRWRKYLLPKVVGCSPSLPEVANLFCYSSLDALRFATLGLLPKVVNPKVSDSPLKVRYLRHHRWRKYLLPKVVGCSPLWWRTSEGEGEAKQTKDTCTYTFNIYI